MSLFLDAVAWLSEPTNWSGANGIPIRLGQHLAITAVAVGVAAFLALPAGVLAGHTRRGAGLIGAIAGAARAIPTLGLLTLIGLAVGIGFTAPLLALVVLAIPSLLAGAYAGIESIDPSVPAAAKAIGMSPGQVLARVELPLASPIIVGGLRAATLQVVATATLAAYTADLGLGRYLFTGLKSREYPQMIGGAILVAALALILELTLAFVQHQATTRVANPADRAGYDPRHRHEGRTS